MTVYSLPDVEVTALAGTIMVELALIVIAGTTRHICLDWSFAPLNALSVRELEAHPELSSTRPAIELSSNVPRLVLVVLPHVLACSPEAMSSRRRLELYVLGIVFYLYVGMLVQLLFCVVVIEFHGEAGYLPVDGRLYPIPPKTKSVSPTT